MNRSKEYEVLLTELEQAPVELENTVQKALKRQKTLQRKKRLGIPAVSLAACLTGFILLVNLFPPFAAACDGIPVLGALAEAVSWSPSLSAAVENNYVQTIGQSQTENGVTASVEYVIVDRKQVSIFYTLDSSLGIKKLDADYDIDLPEENTGYCSSTSSFGQDNGELRRIDVNFIDINVPDTLYLILQVYDSTADRTPDAGPASDNYGDAMLSDRKEEQTYLAEFTFTLEFDPAFTVQGETVPMDASFILDGQSVNVEEAEIYPTHLRLNFSYDPENTAWLTGLDFYLENEHGERFKTTTNSISGTGEPDSPAMASFWVDSPFFSQGKHLTLHITGAEWLDKDQAPVEVDLIHGTAKNLPEDIRIEWTEKRDGGWIVSTSAPYRWGNTTMYDLWGRVEDAAGNEIEVNSTSVTNTPMYLGNLSGDALEEYEAYAKKNQNRYFQTFALRDCAADTVWLSPRYTRVTSERTSLAVTIK